MKSLESLGGTKYKTEKDVAYPKKISGKRAWDQPPKKTKWIWGQIKN